MSSQKLSRLCLRVVADADPGAPARVLERFQILNVVPQRVIAEFGETGMMHIQIDVGELTESTLTLIAANLGQVLSILNAS